jgi:hypothetical protein
MNRLTALCGVAVVMMILAGCERKGQSSAPYDSKKSPPPSAIQVREDPGLLADQSSLSSAAERAKPAAPAATTETPVTASPSATTETPTTAAPAGTTATPVTAPPAGTAAPAAAAATTPASEAEVATGKEYYKQLKTALESDKKEDILAKFNPKDAAILAPILTFDADSGKLVNDLNDSAQKEGIQLSSMIMADLPSVTQDSPLNNVRRIAADNVKVSKRAGDLVVTDTSDNVLVVLTKSADKWQAGFTNEGQAVLVKLVPKCDVARKLAAAVQAGINDKTITKDNVTDKLAEISKQVAFSR